jgi:RNA-directed DNA polymerase
MKRIGNLYEEIISMENLALADKKARKGKMNQYGVKVHIQNAERNLEALHLQLKNKTFKTSDYSIFKVYEPKEREVHRLPYFPDRIVHHAIMNKLETIFVSSFTKDTYSCIKGRGIHAGFRAIKECLKDVPGSTVLMDIIQQIDHGRFPIETTIIRKDKYFEFT